MSAESEGVDLGDKVTQLAAVVEDLAVRVGALEKLIREDHQTLEEDHKKLENLEATGKVHTRPVGL